MSLPPDDTQHGGPPQPPPPPSGVPNRGDLTRRRILDAATALFTSRGPEGASTRAIAAAAGVAQPLLLHHFGSKDELFAAVLDEALGRLAERQAPALAADTPPLDFIVLGLVGLVRAGGEDRALLRLATWARLHGLSPMTEAVQEFWRTVADRFARAQEAGLVRRDLEVRTALVVVDAAVKGFWERADSYAAAGVLGADGLPHAADDLCRLLVRGLCTPEALSVAEMRLAAILIKR